MAALLTLLYGVQAAFSAYNLTLQSTAISNLLNYEEPSQRAAKYSSIAENQLWNARYTQAALTATIITTFLTSTYLLFINASATMGILSAGFNIAGLLWAREYVGNFWKGKSKVPVPGVGDYNEAVGKTQEVRLNMLYMVGGWGLGCLCCFGIALLGTSLKSGLGGTLYR